MMKSGVRFQALSAGTGVVRRVGSGKFALEDLL
jgi:hypothetical protein